MKYLKKFNESIIINQELSFKYTKEDVDKIESVLNELKYIIMDEGYIATLDPIINTGSYLVDNVKKFIRPISIIIDKDIGDEYYIDNGSGVTDRYEDAIISKDFVESHYEEFLNRLRDSLPEFKITEDLGERYISLSIYKKEKA